MTSSSNVRRFMAAAALALPLVFAANANAESKARDVELAQLDLSKPLPSGICFEDNAKGTAASKLITAMRARNQNSVIIADKYTPTGQALDMYTSNLIQVRSDAPNLFGEGYHVVGSHPSNAASTGYCLSALQRTYVVYNDSVQTVPKAFEKGELGKALANGLKHEEKFAFGGLTDLGTFMAVTFNSKTKDGGVLMADGGGNGIMFYTIGNSGYSANLSASARSIIGLPPLAQAAPPAATLPQR